MLNKSGETYDEHSPVMSKKFDHYLNLGKEEEKVHYEYKTEDCINYLKSKTPVKACEGSFNNNAKIFNPENPESLPNFNKRKLETGKSHKTSNSCLFNDNDMICSVKLGQYSQVPDISIDMRNEQLSNARRSVLNNFYRNNTPKRLNKQATTCHSDDEI
jgi:hypothetical protein